MPENIELKAYCDDLDKVRAACDALGAQQIRQYDQEDVYFVVSKGRLKLRFSPPQDPCLIHYERLATSGPRQSSFRLLPVPSIASELQCVLDRAVGTRVNVRKRREVYRLGPALLNLDRVDRLGDFLEIEVEVGRCASREEAQQYAHSLSASLGVTPAMTVPWSYSDIMSMRSEGEGWREKLRRTPAPGTLFLLDGASATGKTTVASHLLQNSHLKPVRRYATRAPRVSELSESQYHFVSVDEFAEISSSGRFLEYRDYEFGMSYGLRWQDAMDPLLKGQDALALINLGNGRHVKMVLPEAVSILLTASQETIRRRLLQRGQNTSEQIEERLRNASYTPYYATHYDHVIENEDGNLAEVIQRILQIVERTSSNRGTSGG